jgi:hypothetical protein
MHKEAHNWVEDSFREWRSKNPDTKYKVLEIGSLDINGSVRSLFNDADYYLGIDMQEGPGVDLVADAAYLVTPDLMNVIVCCEVFEHAIEWRKIVETSYHNLDKGGVFIGTCAGEGRFPHSAIDESPIRDFEYYANVGSRDMKWTLERSHFDYIMVDSINNDVRWVAVK